MVDFFLILAVDLERYGFTELEQRPAIEPGKGMPIEFKTDGHHGTFRLPVKLLADLAVVGQTGDFRVIEDRAVKPRGGFSLIVEPQARGDF